MRNRFSAQALFAFAAVGARRTRNLFLNTRPVGSRRLDDHACCTDYRGGTGDRSWRTSEFYSLPDIENSVVSRTGFVQPFDEHPIVLASMAGAMDFELVAAVSEAGGLGSLPCAMLTAETLRDRFAKIRLRHPAGTQS
jgi:Nitronate monooxygenase